MREKSESMKIVPLSGVVCPWCKHLPDEWVSGEYSHDADGNPVPYEDSYETFAVGCSACESHGPLIKTKEDAIKAWETWG